MVFYTKELKVRTEGLVIDPVFTIVIAPDKVGVHSKRTTIMAILNNHE